MNPVLADPITLALQYLLMLFAGTPIEQIQDQFYESLNDNNFVKGADPTQNQIYDFVVVGGGTTGTVVASRLSENGNVSVLLIEAGSFPFPLTVAPALCVTGPPGMMYNPKMNWKDQQEPQKYCELSKNPTGATYTRPKVLGGGSAVNFMFSMRGSPKDFDRWASVTGDSSWNYENLLEYFKKSENYSGPFKNNKKYHSTSGPMSVELKSYKAPLTEEFLKAGEELGYEEVDPNGDKKEGVYRYVTATKNGRRWSTIDGYIRPAILRPNFQIEINAEVTQILLSPDNQVEGVVYVKRNQTYTVRVRKEVIVSSGSIGSPKLLLLSGIGPKDHLKSVGIPVKVDLPAVGQNLQDHVAIMFGPFVYNKTKILPADDLDDSEENLLNYGLDFISEGKGPLTFTSTDVGGDFRSSMAQPGHADFAIFSVIQPSALGAKFSLIEQFILGTRPGLTEQYMKNDYGKDAFFLTVCLLLPKSRGEVKLRSGNPLDAPIVDPKHLTHEQDLSTLVEGMKLILKFINTKTFKNIDTHLISSPWPGCEAYELKSDAYLTCYAQHLTVSYLHRTSTCSMGKKPSNLEDIPESVVDSKLRVHGVKGLRIADASIMPFITNSNTNVPCIIIGEKAAGEIKRFWADQ